MRKIEFGGVSTTSRAKSFKKMFDTICEYDSESYYESKKTYRHEEDDFTFDYKMVVRVEDFYELSGEEEYKDKLFFELLMVPTTKYFNKNKLENIAHSSCLEDISEVNNYDIVSYGCGAGLGSEMVGGIRSWRSKKITDKLNDIATVVDTIDAMRGFYLDKAWNRMGTTGWDSLHEMVEGKDAIFATINRYK